MIFVSTETQEWLEESESEDEEEEEEEPRGAEGEEEEEEEEDSEDDEGKGLLSVFDVFCNKCFLCCLEITFDDSVTLFCCFFQFCSLFKNISNLWKI